jgi:hypothetical protein
MFSDQREELLEIIQQMYWVDIFSQDKNKDELKISVYGISQKSLTEYTNTEKDIIRGINCIPGAYFLMNNTK